MPANALRMLADVASLGTWLRWSHKVWPATSLTTSNGSPTANPVAWSRHVTDGRWRRDGVGWLNSRAAVVSCGRTPAVERPLKHCTNKRVAAVFTKWRKCYAPCLKSGTVDCRQSVKLKQFWLRTKLKDFLPQTLFISIYIISQLCSVWSLLRLLLKINSRIRKVHTSNISDNVDIFEVENIEYITDMYHATHALKLWK